MTSEIRKNSVFLSAKGGVLDIIRDGEVLASIAVPAGRVSAAEYLDLVPLGASLEVAEGLAVLHPREAVGIQPYGQGSHDTGANPDFQPTSASRMEMQMRLTLNQLQASTAALEARQRALESIERVPMAPAPAAAPAAVPEAEAVVVE